MGYFNSSQNEHQKGEIMEDKILLLNDILDGLGESFRIESKIVHKNNETLLGLCLVGGKIAPTIYINEDEFLKESNETIVKELRDVYRSNVGFDFNESMTSRDYILKHVYPRLLSKENEAWAKEDHYIYTCFLDMIVMYYVKLPDKNGTIASYTLHESHVSNAGLEKKDIKRAAVSNLKDHVEIRRMDDILREAFGEMPPMDFGMYVLTNTWKTNGAAVILIDDLLGDISGMTSLYSRPVFMSVLQFLQEWL